MNARLQKMHHSCLQEAAASDRARSERLVSQCCLASFLSFLTFSVHAGSTASDSNGCHSHFRPATDLNAALYAAALAKSLEWVVPWVVQYVRFASQDSDAQQSCCIQQLLQRLHSIQSCTALLPGSPQFGGVASCLRCVLDDHLEQSADIERTAGEADAAWLPALQSWNTADLRGSIFDARYLQLCCPLLEQARQAIQVMFRPSSPPPPSPPHIPLLPSLPIPLCPFRSCGHMQSSQSQSVLDLQQTGCYFDPSFCICFHQGTCRAMLLHALHWQVLGPGKLSS